MKTFPLLFVFAAFAAAQTTEWKVGLASTDITPHEPIPMGGYANRTAPFEAVEAPLFAKVLALEDSTGAKAVIITADLLGFLKKHSTVGFVVYRLLLAALLVFLVQQGWVPAEEQL